MATRKWRSKPGNFPNSALLFLLYGSRLTFEKGESREKKVGHANE